MIKVWTGSLMRTDGYITNRPVHDLDDPHQDSFSMDHRSCALGQSLISHNFNEETASYSHPQTTLVGELNVIFKLKVSNNVAVEKN